jgi:hypothetical protein
MRKAARKTTARKSGRSTVKAPAGSSSSRHAGLPREHREALKSLEAMPPPKSRSARVIREAAKRAILSGEPRMSAGEVAKLLGRD